MTHTSEQTSADITSDRTDQTMQGHDNTNTKQSPADSDDNSNSSSSLGLTINRLRRHFAESAIFYLVGLCLFLAILLPIFFKVILPTVIQYFVNNRDVQLRHAHVFLQDANTIQLSANASFESPLPALVDDISISLQANTISSESFTKFNVPGLGISRNTEVRLTTPLRIINEAELVKWATEFINSDEIPIKALSSKVTVRLGVLEYSVNLDKAIIVQGLQNVNITVQSLKLIAPAKSNGKNIRATFQLINQSSLTVVVGDLTLGVRVGGSLDVATINIPNLTLVPGKNIIDVDGDADIGYIIKNLPDILKSQKDTLGSGIIQIELRGKNAAATNGKPLPFLTTLLQVRPILVNLPLLLIVDAVINVVFTSMTPSVESKNIGVFSIINSVSQVLSNQTFLEKIGKHWENRTTSRYSML